MKIAPVPIRVTRSRRPGWKAPKGAKYIGRPTAWGNPFVVGLPVPERCPFLGEDYGIHSAITLGIHFSVDDCNEYVIQGKPVPDRHTAKRLFRALLCDFKEYKPELLEKLLNGIRSAPALMCWCAPGTPCHVDVWIEFL